MTPKVVRLPRQHRQKPHCLSCGAPLPTLKGMELFLLPSDLGDAVVETLTLLVRCRCGAQVNMTKKCR
jgi:hypothetical protein